MKQILLTAFLLTSVFANAQLIRGDKVLGGTLSFFLQDADSQNGGLTNNVNSISITPRMGFLLKDNFAIGGQLGLGYAKQETTAAEYKSKSISLGIFSQKYFNITDKFLFSVIGQFNFTRGQDTYPYFDPFLGEIAYMKAHNYTLTASIRPNFTFFPSHKWAVETGIGLLSYSYLRSLSTDEKANISSLNYGSLTLGVSYYFRKTTEN